MNLKLPLLLGCCLFAAITACAETSASLDENAAGKKKADVYITTADRQQSFNHTTQKLSKTPAFESVITLNSKVKFQEMDGFRCCRNRFYLLQSDANDTCRPCEVSYRNFFG